MSAKWIRGIGAAMVAIACVACSKSGDSGVATPAPGGGMAASAPGASS